jgi:hypothetical protein
MPTAVEEIAELERQRVNAFNCLLIASGAST